MIRNSIKYAFQLSTTAPMLLASAVTALSFKWDIAWVLLYGAMIMAAFALPTLVCFGMGWFIRTKGVRDKRYLNVGFKSLNEYAWGTWKGCKAKWSAMCFMWLVFPFACVWYGVFCYSSGAIIPGLSPEIEWGLYIGLLCVLLIGRMHREHKYMGWLGMFFQFHYYNCAYTADKSNNDHLLIVRDLLVQTATLDDNGNKKDTGVIEAPLFNPIEIDESRGQTFIVALG